MQYRIKIVNNFDGKGDLFYPQFKSSIFSSWKTIRKSSGELDLTLIFPKEACYKCLADATQLIMTHKKEKEKLQKKQIVKYIYDL